MTLTDEDVWKLTRGITSATLDIRISELERLGNKIEIDPRDGAMVTKLKLQEIAILIDHWKKEKAKLWTNA
jgi:hypothetical protein